MAPKPTVSQPSESVLLAQAEEAGQVVTHDGERYLDVDAAGVYLGKRPSTMWLYIRRYTLETYNFPLYGKRAFLRQRDLNGLRILPPKARQRKGKEGKGKEGKANA
jgi:hypothetical protein